MSSITVDEYSERYIRNCCCGGAGFVRVNVPIGHPLFGKAIPCLCRRDAMAKERAERLRRQSGIRAEEWQRWSLEAYNPYAVQPVEERERMRDIVEWLRGYAKAPQGWIVLQGPVGTGKTHLAYGMAQLALQHGHAVFAHTVPDLLAMLRETYNQGNFDAMFSDICGVGLLLLDDLGSQRDTDWAQEQLYRMINFRYVHRLPTAVTMNVGLEQLDDRVRSRLVEGTRVSSGLSRMIVLKLQDYRPIKTWKAA